MADNRKYYYLKLKENFFDSDSIVLLEDMKDGVLYSNILLKLYLKSLKNGGRLQLDEHIPYTAQMIATLTRHQIGTVERALAIFQQLGLVEQLDCGLLYMTDIELMIGQSSTEAERKRAARLENKALLPPRTNGGHLSDIRPPEIEIKKEIDIELEKEGELKGQALARSYGRYENVFLTDWEIMREENIGYLLWGKVGTGKSYFAGCIANALMEQEVAVRMTNFSAILNDLTASFEGRNEYIERLCRFPLLIIDDFGMERGTEYGLEQVYNVIDSRYRSRKPLIVTTNLTLDSLQNPLDTAHARIYDRLLEMCAPILFTGENFRRETAQAKLNRLKELMK